MTHRSLRFAACAAFLAVTGALTFSCAAVTDGSDDADESGLDGVDPATPSEGEAVASTSDELHGCNQCDNCVYYATCRQPRLPGGLFTYQDKVRRINRRTPRAGCVAVIRTNTVWGHVAYVRSVNGSTIHIDEGNWPWGHCGSRSGTQGQLNITGYICP